MCYNRDMRAILNVSLPVQMVAAVDEAVLEGEYMSKSELIRKLLRDWQESRMLGALKKSSEEIASGKGKLLKSLKDLR